MSFDRSGRLHRITLLERLHQLIIVLSLVAVNAGVIIDNCGCASKCSGPVAPRRNDAFRLAIGT